MKTHLKLVLVSLLILSISSAAQAIVKLNSTVLLEGQNVNINNLPKQIFNKTNKPNIKVFYVVKDQAKQINILKVFKSRRRIKVQTPFIKSADAMAGKFVVTVENVDTTVSPLVIPVENDPLTVSVSSLVLDNAIATNLESTDGVALFDFSTETINENGLGIEQATNTTNNTETSTETETENNDENNNDNSNTTGTPGPQGPAGPAGATGAQGPQGPAGLASVNSGALSISPSQGVPFADTTVGVQRIGDDLEFVTDSATKLTIKDSGALVSSEYSITVANDINLDWNNGNQQTLLLNQDVNSITMLNINPAQTLRLLVCQDATGGRSINTWSANISWRKSNAPTVTTTANECDMFSFIGSNISGSAKAYGAATQEFAL